MKIAELENTYNLAVAFGQPVSLIDSCHWEKNNPIKAMELGIGDSLPTTTRLYLLYYV